MLRFSILPKEGLTPSPSFLFLPLMLKIHLPITERGTKQVPRKIEDFSGCFKGVRLINNLSCFLLVLVGWLCYDASKANMTTEKEKALELAISQIEKRFGKGSVMKLGEGAIPSVEAIPSGSPALDLALGVGGIPRGRVTEIFGPEASGKTTLAQHIIAEAQKLGGVAAYIDAEHALDPTYAANCGVNVNDLLISQPDTGEQALEITEALVRSGAVDVIAIDSVAALVPQAEIEGEMGEAHVGLQARLMSQALRKLAAAIGKSGTAVIFINQLREKVGIIFGNPEVTPGGRALKFYSSVRIDLRRIDSIKQGDEVKGSLIRAKVVKNKVAPPFKSAQFDIMFDHGISKEGNFIDLGVELGIVKKTGAFFSYGDVRLGQGRENAKQYLSQNPELAQEIGQRIRASAITTHSPLD
jgi:recombination protein RecA